MKNKNETAEEEYTHDRKKCAAGLDGKLGGI
jgi:hypothetical protein